MFYGADDLARMQNREGVAGAFPSMSYGALNPKDVEVLEYALSRVGTHIKFLEIGVHTGTTARGVRDYANANCFSIEYWGIDPHPPDPNPPFPMANFVQGFSEEVFHLIPDGFNVVLIDGCHCINHVMLDVLHYAPRVVKGGFLLFHDICPKTQHTYVNSQNMHGPDIPQFKNAVLDALALLKFPYYPWVLAKSQWDDDLPWGGMAAYRKLPRLMP
jgi:hypothetical protein